MPLSYAEKSARLKPLEWETPNKAKLGTGHKGFDRHLIAPAPGNVWGPGQFSNHIRPVTETKCNGFDFPPGDLREADLKAYRGDKLRPHSWARVENWFRLHPDVTAILYRFSTPHRVLGYIITGADYRHFATFYEGFDTKGMRALDAVRPYVSWNARDWPEA